MVEKNNKIKLRIGIDPDLKKSGLAVITSQPFQKQTIIELTVAPFFSVLETIERYNKDDRYNLTVMLEGGWLNKVSNYHDAPNKQIAGRIGKNVGENHAVGKLMEEWCLINNVKCTVVKPVTSKWNAKIFKMVTGWVKSTNQEHRDAVRVAWF